MPIPNQPTPPAEGAYNDIERLLISEQPNRLWPENQNSNFGMLRKVIADDLQAVIDMLSALYAEMFPETSVAYLGRWERETGLPRGTGLGNDFRRLLIHSRRQVGPFTRTRRREIVEAFIRETFGISTEILPAGIPLTAGGVTLYSETVDVSTTYTITENITNFSYNVNIVPTVDPDMDSLVRELDHMTPAHISYTITRNP
jgi:hypothetical protein